MKLYNIYIPKHYNDGKKIPKEVIDEIIGEIDKKFKKYTFQEKAKLPLVQGIWTSPKGKRYSDKVYLLYLIIEGTTKDKIWLTKKANKWCKKLDQEEFLIVEQYAEVIIGKK